ncbi:MAG: YihY/virulence factor BrkB family protein [Solirubrobacterales bacterium]|nr:YihY/virulence factor BrkB family protein [Solirubrobacterales bacterium]
MSHPNSASRASALSRVVPGPRRLRLGVVHLWDAICEIAKDIWQINVTGLASMLAYNMLLAVVPLALLGLFVAGQVLASHTAMNSVEHDLQTIFPGTTKATLDSLLHEVAGATPTIGVLALIASLWLASSFWGALDTSFSRIYRCQGRPWLKQKRFGIVMVGVVLAFMLASVLVPTMQSLLRNTANSLPIHILHVHSFVWAVSLAFGVVVLFACLVMIYSRVPNRRIPWRAIWPGALGASLAMCVVDFGFPLYLSSVSTIAHFGTTLVFIVIVLGWFYVMALIILVGGVVNARALRRGDGPHD